MVIEKLSLNNFRNYRACSLQFNKKLNFIFGGNGNGKTNLLEAISVLCFTKSFLQAADIDCLKYGEIKSVLNGEFTDYTGVRTIIRYEYDKILLRKKIMRNNEVINRMHDLLGSIPLTILSPQDLKLSYGAPAERRRNFDLLLSQTNRLYFDELIAYNRILKQKNTLLKDNLFSKKYSISELKKLISGWNDDLVIKGANLMEKRNAFESEFKRFLSASFTEITKGHSKPVLKYTPDIRVNISRPFNKMEAYELFYSKLQEIQDKEIKRGFSLAGPHRDEWQFAIIKNGNEFEMKYFASQGEQKTYIIALKFAEYNYLKEIYDGTVSGEPILMLDDIYSELDIDRILQITKIMSLFNQVFVTTTNPDYAEILKKHFEIGDIATIRVSEGVAEHVN